MKKKQRAVVHRESIIAMKKQPDDEILEIFNYRQ